MAHLLICVRTEDTLLDYTMLSREKSKVEFDDTGIGIALRYDPCTQAGQYFLMQKVLEITEDDSLCDFDNYYKNDATPCKECGDNIANEQEPAQYRLSFVQLVIKRKLSLMFPSSLAYCCYKEMLKSKVFLIRCLNYLKRHTAGCWREGWFPMCECQEVEDMCDCSLTVPKLIEIFVHPAQVNVCHSW